MNKEFIEIKLKDIFEGVGVHVEREMYDKELNLDSLQFVTIAIEIEEFFKVALYEMSHMENIKTFSDYRQLLEDRLINI